MCNSLYFDIVCKCRLKHEFFRWSYLRSLPLRPEKREMVSQVCLSPKTWSHKRANVSCTLLQMFGKNSFISIRNYFDLNTDSSKFNCVQFNSGSFLAPATKPIQKSGAATMFLALKMDRVSEMKRETAAKSGCIENSNLDWRFNSVSRDLSCTEWFSLYSHVLWWLYWFWVFIHLIPHTFRATAAAINHQIVLPMKWWALASYASPLPRRSGQPHQYLRLQTSSTPRRLFHEKYGNVNEKIILKKVT